MELRKQILEYLKGKNFTPTSAISNDLRQGYWKVVRELEILEKENKIEKNKVIVWSYWKLK